MLAHRSSFSLVALALVSAACAPASSPICPAAETRPPPVAPAPSGDVTPLVMGEVLHVESKILGERRVVNVYLPPGYGDSNARYPVLYMPDGGLKEDFPHIAGLVDVSVKNETMRPFLVVGIENTERRRDLVGPTSVAAEKPIAPHAGGADNFRRFLRDELKPLVAARFRTTTESALVGESFAGLFVVETLLVEPDLFDTYVAVSPSLWWNDRAVARSAAALPTTWPGKPKSLFLATSGDEGPLQHGSDTLVATLRERKPVGLTLHYVPMPDEKHATIFHPAALMALRAFFGPSKATSR
jgi:predicted alpha/beta superfamily hydrolase